MAHALQGVRPVLRRPFTILLTGQWLSALGDQFFQVALPVVVLHHFGAVVLGTTVAVFGVFRLLGLAFGGALTDRFTPRAIMLAADAVRGPTCGVLAALVWTGQVSPWRLAVCSAVLGTASGGFQPAEFSMLPRLVGPELIQAATGLNFALIRLAAFVGPAVAGPSVAALGPGPALMVDAVSYAVSVGALWSVGPGRAPRAASRPAAGGVRQVVAEVPLLKTVMVMAAVGGLGFGGVLTVGLPALVGGRAGWAFSAEYGYVLAALGAGSMAGGAVVATLPVVRNVGKAACRLTLIQAVLVASAAAAPAWFVLVAAFAAVGALNSAVNVLLMTLVQQRVPGRQLGRISSAMLIASLGLLPVSALLAGFAVAAAGAASVFLTGAALMAAASLIGLASPSVRSPLADAPAPAESLGGRR